MDIVLLGGWSRNENSYRKLILNAPQRCTLHFIDHRDLFEKNRFDPDRSITSFLKKNKLSKVVLIGHSLGGAIALNFTNSYPNLVTKLYLLDSEGVFGDESIVNLITKFLLTHKMHARRKSRENVGALLRLVKNPVRHFGLAKFAHNADLEKKAGEIRVTTKILWGEKDYLTPVWQGEKLHKAIKGSELVVINNMDHDWVLHSPQFFWENF